MSTLTPDVEAVDHALRAVTAQRKAAGDRWDAETYVLLTKQIDVLLGMRNDAAKVTT